MGRFLSIWFRYLTTDWFSLRKPELKRSPFVLRTPVHGKMVVTSANANALAQGVIVGMPLADARAIVPGIQVQDDPHDLPGKLLRKLAVWSIRFSPVVAVDLPNGLLIDATGCSNLWGGEERYVQFISKKLSERGYDVRLSMADTIGVAWAVARYGKAGVVAPGRDLQAILSLPPESLRIDPEVAGRLHKLGLHKLSDFLSMPRHSLRRRFGPDFIQRIEQALGQQLEILEPVIPTEPFEVRVPSMEPIVTGPGIQIALEKLVHELCELLSKSQVGLRKAIFKCFRVDGNIQELTIGTSRPTHHAKHILKLFESKLEQVEPGLGLDLFVLCAPVVEEHVPQQEEMWNDRQHIDEAGVSELVDRLATRLGSGAIQKYLPAEHYWPERSYTVATSLSDKPSVEWRGKSRPLYLFTQPERIEVTAPIPDYPPMLFRYRGQIHKISKADGPERIEQEWWLQQGQHRDYYQVEDEEGNRYWLFRLGHYHDKSYQWFLHGIFG